MSELLLVNPRRRKRRAGKRKMSAKQALYFGPKRRRKTRRRRSVAAVAAAPRRHRRRSRRIVRSVGRSVRRRVTRMRRNPIRMHMGGFSAKRFLSDTLIPAGIGAGGALGVDIALGYLGARLPASLQTGLPNVAVKLAAAVGIGMAAGALGGKRMGEQAMAGAVVVTLYSLIKTQLQAAMPSLPLHGYNYNMGWVSPALQTGPFAAYVGSDNAYGGGQGMGMYIGESESDYVY